VTQNLKAQATMLEIVKELRADKKRYAAFKSQLKGLKTDEARAEKLIDFVIKDERITRAVGGQEAMAAITTVTVTTVIIIAPSAY